MLPLPLLRYYLLPHGDRQIGVQGLGDAAGVDAKRHRPKYLHWGRTSFQNGIGFWMFNVLL